MDSFNDREIELMGEAFLAQQQVTDEDGEAIVIHNYISGSAIREDTVYNGIQEEQMSSGSLSIATVAGPSPAAAAAAFGSVTARISNPVVHAMSMGPAAQHSSFCHPLSGQIILGGSDAFDEYEEEEGLQPRIYSAPTGDSNRAMSTTTETAARIKALRLSSPPSSPPSSPSPVDSSPLSSPSSSSSAMAEAGCSLLPPPSSTSNLVGQELANFIVGLPPQLPPVRTVNARDVELNPSSLLLQEISRAAPGSSFLSGYQNYTGLDADDVMRWNIINSINNDNIIDNNINNSSNGDNTNIVTTNNSSRSKKKNKNKRRNRKNKRKNGNCNNNNNGDNNNNENSNGNDNSNSSSNNDNNDNENSDNNNGSGNDNITGSSSNDKSTSASSNDNIAGASTGKSKKSSKTAAARKKKAAKRKGKKRAASNGTDATNEEETAGQTSNSITVAVNNASTTASSSSSPSHTSQSNGTGVTTPSRASDGSNDLADPASDQTVSDEDADQLILPTPNGSIPSYVGSLRASASRAHDSDSDGENATEDEDPEEAATQVPVLAEPRSRPPRGHKKPRYAFVDGHWENVNGATVNGNRGIKAISPAKLKRKYGRLMGSLRNSQAKTGQSGQENSEEEDESEEGESDGDESIPHFRDRYNHDPDYRDQGNPGFAIPCQ